MSRRMLFPLVLALGLMMNIGCSDDEETDPTPTNNSNNVTTNNSTNNATNNATNNVTTNNATNNATNNVTTNNSTNNATNNATNGTNNVTNGTNSDLSCQLQGMTACFTNDDCAVTYRCENTAADGELELACCVEGARGTGVLGDACADENECATGLCVQKNDEPQTCTQLCDVDNECPMDYTCHAVLAMCFPDAI